MAMTLAELQAKRDAVVKEIDVASVRFADGRSVDYVADKQRVLAAIDVEIAKLGTTRLRRTVVQTVKGW